MELKPENQSLDDNENNAKLSADLIFEVTSIKDLIPQIQATLVTACFNLMVGMAIAFPGILIPEIEKPDSDIKVSVTQSSWIASSSVLTMGLSGIITGFLSDVFGRLNTIRLSVIPSVMGWILVATANNASLLLAGRITTGIGMLMCSNPAANYLVEIIWPNFRGSFLLLMCVFSSIGIELVYFKKFVFHWRTIAWCSAFYYIVAVGFTFFIHESPSWLVRKGKFKRASESVKWLHRYQTSRNTSVNYADIHLSIIKKEDNYKKEIEARQTQNKYLHLFLKRSVYKPTIILSCLFIIQQFSGLSTVMAYSITFFENSGVKIHPLLASNIMNGLPVVISIMNIYTLKRFDRRTLLITSCIGASICLFVSGLYTKWIQCGLSDRDWIPMVFLFLYMSLITLGLEPIPWIVLNELVRIELRGILTSLISSFCIFVMFATIHSYPYLNIYLGGAGVQFLFATASVVGSFFVYFFLPETQGKTLFEIESYFD